MKESKFKKTIAIIVAIVLIIGVSAGTAILVKKKTVPAMTTVENGLSAYELAVKYGYEGTVQEWLESLNGKSAYEIAKANGYTGTETEWASSLKATAGKDGVGIKTAAFSDSNELIITLTDGTVLNLGVADGLNGKDGTNGKDGANGADGKDGVGITSANINAEGQLVLSFSDGKTVNLDKVVGMNGKDGIGVSSANINTNGELVITYTNGQTANLGVVVGTKGDKGETGAQINSDGELVLIFSNNQRTNVGNVIGAKGEKGDKGDTGAQGQQGIQGDKGDKGDKGDTGAAGNDGVSVTKTEINNKGELVITLSDKTVSNLGVVVGAKGDKGETGAAGQDGDDGVGIETIVIENGNLKITLTNETTLDLGNIKGEKGDTGAKGEQGIQGIQGETGNGIASATINEFGELVIVYTNGEDINLGKVVGEKGDTGAAGQDGQNGTNGVGVASININEDGELFITYTEGNPVNLGKIIGPQGAQGLQGEKGDKGDKGDKGEQGIQGEKGDTGAAGQDGQNGTNGVGVSSVELINNELVITLSDTTVINLGNVKGEKGDKGETGAQGIQGEKGDKGQDGKNGNDGVGIAKVTLDTEGNLSVTFTTGTTVNLGNVKGNDGSDGVGIEEMYIQNGSLYVRKTNETTAQNLGSVKGEKGDKGDKGDAGAAGNTGVDGKSAYELYCEAYPDYTGTLEEWLTSLKGETGRGIVKAEIIDNSLVITFSDGEVKDIGGFETKYVEDEHEVFEINRLSNDTYSITGIKDNQLEEIVIPTRINGLPVTKIASNAFEGNTSIKKVVLADSIIEIGDSAFKNCTSLEAIEIGTDSELTTFSAYSFYNCTALKHIYIPKTVIFIGNYAFYKSGLETAYFEDYIGWNIIGQFNSYYHAFYRPVGLDASAILLSRVITIDGEKHYFYKNNIQKSDVNINVDGYYYRNLGTRE